MEKGEEQKHLFELICHLKFLISSRTQRLLECNLLSPDMKYFNVNYRKERQHFDTLESVKKVCTICSCEEHAGKDIPVE